MQIGEFESLLSQVVARLTEECKTRSIDSAILFEQRVREEFQSLLSTRDGLVVLPPVPQAFPDIQIPPFGIEVKHTLSDTWRTIGNSVSESKKTDRIKHIYLVFGKMGGQVPEVKWGRYGDCVVHVRTTHVPRFEVEINAEKPLFRELGVTYEEFANSDFSRKMEHIRAYARKRILKTGEHLWWIENDAEPTHSLPLQPKLYVNLESSEKRRMRAEAALLCPKIVQHGRGMSNKDKYHEVVTFLLTYHGVLCSQARDLFSAGSAGGTKDGGRGGNYIVEGLKDIEPEMIKAACNMDRALFVEYWNEDVPPENRIRRWLELADSYASTWVPSEVLFKENSPDCPSRVDPH